MSYPEKIIQIGKCRVSIFRNALIKDGQRIDMPKVVLDIRYKDEQTGRWKSTSSMTLPEIPKAILALIKAFDYLMTKA